MFFILLVYIAALSLETFGSYLSVIGLAAKTGPILVILVITLDFSKIMIASVLYKRWKDIHLALKLILVPVLIALVTVTSTGTYGYLIKEFNKTTSSTEQQKAKIDILEKEKDRLETRKQAIDIQISQLPTNSVIQRRRLTELFSKESNYINSRLLELNNELPNLKIKSLQTNNDSGTLGGIAEAYNVTPVQVNKIVALFIVFFVDPLAIVLLTLANFLSEYHKKELKLMVKSVDIPKENTIQNLLKNDKPISVFTHKFLNKHIEQTQIDKTISFLDVNGFISNIEKVEDKVSSVLTKQITYVSLKDIIKDPIKINRKKDSILLKSNEIINEVIVQSKVNEFDFKKATDILLQVNNFLEDKSIYEIKKQKLLPHENIFSSVNELTENIIEPKLFIKPKPQTLSSYSKINNGNGFFEDGGLPHYIPSNCPEDNIIITSDDIWDDNAIFENKLRNVQPIQVKGSKFKNT